MIMIHEQAIWNIQITNEDIWNVLIRSIKIKQLLECLNDKQWIIEQDIWYAWIRNYNILNNIFVML